MRKPGLSFRSTPARIEMVLAAVLFSLSSANIAVADPMREDGAGCTDKTIGARLVLLEDFDPAYIGIWAKGMHDQSCRGYGAGQDVAVDDRGDGMACVRAADDDACFWVRESMAPPPGGLIGGTPSSGQAATAPSIAGCAVFPADNVWNTPTVGLPVHPNSAAYVESIGSDEPLKADFGSGEYEGAPIGIPYIIVPADQPAVAIRFTGYGDEPDAFEDESDPGPYPIPADAPIEGGTRAEGDRHVIVVQRQNCTLFELYKAAPNADGSWNAVAAARFDLKGHDLRPTGWTSADAAGLPIFPGLVRYEEVVAGEIAHALRFTAQRTGQAHVWPARHLASRFDDPSLPPMGQRFRLKADVDISGYSADTQVILRALQTYGMILADNGSPWFISGVPNDSWNNDSLNTELRQLTGSDFEAVDVSALMIDPDSAAAAGGQ